MPQSTLPDRPRTCLVAIPRLSGATVTVDVRDPRGNLAAKEQHLRIPIIGSRASMTENNGLSLALVFVRSVSHLWY